MNDGLLVSEYEKLLAYLMGGLEAISANGSEDKASVDALLVRAKNFIRQVDEQRKG